MQEDINNEKDCCGGKMCWHGKHCVKMVVVVALSLLSIFLLAETIGVVKSYKFIGTNPASQGTISVSGKGEVVAVPDIANVSFTVSNEALVAGDAQAKSSKEMNSILALLKKDGIADKDIKTTSYNIYPRYEYSGSASSYYPYPSGKQILAAYVVSQSVLVKIRDISKAGKILADLGESGATDISGLSFANDKQDDLQKQARDQAITQAEADAEKLASALGVNLVRILNYSENGNYPIYYAKADMMSSGVGGGAVAPQVPAGENTITSNVTITYEVK
jgi:uncharacterized protein YggE